MTINKVLKLEKTYFLGKYFWVIAFLFLTDKEVEQYHIDHPTSTLQRTVGTMKKPTGNPGRPSIAHRYIINFIIQPEDVRNALSGLEGGNWKSAMRDEYNSLISNGT